MTQEPVGTMHEALGAEGDNPPRPREPADFFLTAWCEDCEAPYAPKGDGEAAECSACGALLTTREWPVAPCELRIMGQFEKWVQRRAKLAYQTEDDLSEAERLRSTYLSDYTAGHYSWTEHVTGGLANAAEATGKHVKNALHGGAGLYHLMYLLMRRCDPKVGEGLARRAVDAGARHAIACLGWALGNWEAPARRTTTPAGAKAERTTGRPPEHRTGHEAVVSPPARRPPDLTPAEGPLTMADLAREARESRPERPRPVGRPVS